jgi:hypothetical protein
MRNRPPAVLIVAIFLYFATAMAALVGTSLLFPSPLDVWLWKLNPAASEVFHAHRIALGTFLLTLAIATFAAARGLLKGKKWAWWFAVILFSVNVCGDLISFFLTRDLARSGTGVMVAAAFLFTLTQPRLRTFFKL